MGVPLRIEIGIQEAERHQVTIALRTTGQKITASIDALDQVIPTLIRSSDQALIADARLFFESSTADAGTVDELMEVLNSHRGFVRVPFCSVTQEGEPCAEVLKDRANGPIVCGVPFEEREQERKSGTCIVCGKPSKSIVYSARSL